MKTNVHRAPLAVKLTLGALKKQRLAIYTGTRLLLNLRPPEAVGGSYRVARGRNYPWTTAFTAPIEVRLA